MELAMIIIVILLAYCLSQKLESLDITRRISPSQNLSSKKEGSTDKSGLLPAIRLVLREPPDDPKGESRETVTLIVTDSFHKRWEVTSE
jgi:hypothetical protein